MRRAVQIGAVATLLAAMSPAHGQSASGSEVVAESLFREASELIESGNYAAACPKLEASQRADPGGGTVLLLALCYEELGRTASAWLRFNEALAMARADRRPDREARAREHLASIEPRLSFLELTVAEPNRGLPDFRIELDGSPLPLGGTTTSLPLDPGRHRIRASARGKVAWTASLTIGADADRRSVVVPPLADPPRPSPTPPPPAAARGLTANDPPPPAADRRHRPPGATQRRAASVIAVAGLATVGSGLYFGVVALDRNGDAEDLCPEPSCTNATGVELSHQAFDNADRANALLAVGAAVTVTGATLYLTAPRRRAGAALRVTAAGDRVELGWNGTF